MDEVRKGVSDPTGRRKGGREREIEGVRERWREERRKKGR